MKISFVVVFLFLLGSFETLEGAKSRNAAPKGTVMTREQELETALASVATQMVQQQAFIEERTRTDGDSGLKQVRVSWSGTRPYFISTHTGGSVASMHDHSNNIRTNGMGEFSVVLNGVEFRTRHNDYRMNMPHRTSKTYHSWEPIEFPEVPKEVTSKKNINDQIEEMREWFKAWQAGDYKQRDYRKYFKPVLCYLEGAWHADSKTFEESFFSDRHQLDASSWYDLQQKVRYTTYTGSKNSLENFAFLPTKIFGFTNTSVPMPLIAQWNYRILCHPLKRDVPINRLRVVDDLSTRMRMGKTLEDYTNTRAARFTIDPFNKGDYRTERISKYGLLDELMYEIPGKDNYQGKISDNGMGETAYRLDKPTEKLNAAFYHRFYRVTTAGAMGSQQRARGFADDNLFVAFNSQDKIAGVSLKDCKTVNGKAQCGKYDAKVSYAIPLELVYMTPLASWNPYGIEYKGRYGTPEAKTVEAGGRNGVSKPYDGINDRLYFMTPAEFYSGEEVGKSAADTSPNGARNVLDRRGKSHAVRSSGHRILMPNIPGVGVVRQRYPIMPIHGAGSTVFKELDALKDMILEPEKYRNMYYGKLPSTSVQSGNTAVVPKQTTSNNKDTSSSTKQTTKTVDNSNDKTSSTKTTSGSQLEGIVLKTSLSTKTPPLPHTHTITLTGEEVQTLQKKRTLKKTSSEDNGHSHQLDLYYHPRKKVYMIRDCDGTKWKCWDGHSKNLVIVKN